MAAFLLTFEIGSLIVVTVSGNKGFWGFTCPPPKKTTSSPSPAIAGTISLPAW